jgi:hypothetical protein
MYARHSSHACYMSYPYHSFILLSGVRLRPLQLGFQEYAAYQAEDFPMSRQTMQLPSSRLKSLSMSVGGEGVKLSAGSQNRQSKIRPKSRRTRKQESLRRQQFVSQSVSQRLRRNWTNGRSVGERGLENQLSKRLIPQRRSCTPSSTPFPYFLLGYLTLPTVSRLYSVGGGGMVNLIWKAEAA